VSVLSDRVERGVGYVLVVVGVGLVAGAAAFSAYDRYERARSAQEVAPLAATPPLARPPASPAAILPAPGTDANAESQPAPADFGPTAVGELGGLATSRRGDAAPVVLPDGPGRVDGGRVLRIVAPTIDLDAPVVESPLVHGEWQVPPFAAGHLAGTAQPLRGGNVALAGHLQNLARGNVFADLDRLRVGDVVRLYTDRAVVVYQVAKVETVSRDDLGVLAPTSHETLTLITCAGTWLPLQRDYSERTVVVADGID
jgi:LPXTG-site transpeptidase (sortase) family protein